MQILTALIIWIINSFKWFSFLVGGSLILYLFSKEKNENGDTFTYKHIIEALLIIQPVAVANSLNHFGIEGKIAYYIAAISVIPFFIYFSISRNNK